jgi:uncharacterized membrane protein
VGIGTTWFSWLEKISSIGSHFVKITQYIRHPFAVRSYPCLTFGKLNWQPVTIHIKPIMIITTLGHISLNSLSLESVTRWVLLLLFTHVEKRCNPSGLKEGSSKIIVFSSVFLALDFLQQRGSKLKQLQHLCR